MFDQNPATTTGCVTAVKGGKGTMTTDHRDLEDDDHKHDDSDADAFAVLSLLVIITLAIVWYLST
jgi:hypothetical protein